MKKLVALGAIGVFTSCLFAQGLTTSATKDDWEEINFEFNSSILSDGYPSLLRLADLLKQHGDYRVAVNGHTDNIGSAAFNEKLALARATTVKDFLVKYGATAAQITIASEGKAKPAVENKSKEGRFINRRVVLTLKDAAGKVVSAGGVSEAIHSFDELLKKQEECCSQILKRLDKLDDILAALKDLRGENDRLKGEVADLRTQQSALRDQQNGLKEQVAGLPKPLTAKETTDIAKTEGLAAIDEAQRRNKKFSLLGLNVGPTYGAGRTGNFTVSGRGQFFSPFGGSGSHAVQAQGEYMYYPGRQEGQFDIGLVNRWNNVQAGLFSSFKYLSVREYQSGGALAQGAFLVDYLFSRGKVGLFATKGFKNFAVLNRANLAPQTYLETYARIVDQLGMSATVGAWGNSYFEGNLGYLKRHGSGSDRPGGMLRLVQPLNDAFAVTFEGGLNETLLNTKDSGRFVVGFQYGSFIRPKEYVKTSSPVPMDVPRVRYEMLTRRVGNTPPVADAGLDQIGVPAGTITLDGSASYDPDGSTLTYAWQQIGGAAVSISGVTAAKATFTAAQGQTYVFRLTVKDPAGLQSSARVTVTTGTPPTVRVLRFDAAPNTIRPGQSSHLTWVVEGADSVTIQPAPGKVDPKAGSADVTLQQTTTYTLTAQGPGGTVNQTVIVTVSASDPRIIRFEASPLNVQPGQSSTLSWTTDGASDIAISGVGPVAASGSVVVTPSQTTTYTLTARNTDGRQVTAPVVVTVGNGQVPQVLQFVASPANIDAGGVSKLCWQVSNSTSISITGIGDNLKVNDCVSVSPSTTTTYTLTAINAQGQIQANAIVNVGQVKILSFSAFPQFQPIQGDPVVLTWTTQNANSVVVTRNFITSTTSAPNGSITVHPSTDSTYTLTAYGPGGTSVSSTLLVTVR